MRMRWLLLLAAGCGDGAMISPPEDRAVDCRAELMEDDSVDDPLLGPAVADGRVLPSSMPGTMVSTTYLVLRPEQSARFQQLMGPILQQLPSQPGLLAWQFKNSSKCGTARTFAVWENEEQMFEFVRSPAHLDAIRNQLVVATPASTTVAFEAQPHELTWERALQEFDAEAGTR